jgi:LysM repeat protein
LTQAGPILQTLGESVKTNLTLEQIIQLAQLAAQIDPSRIRLITITPDMVLPLHVDSNPPQDALVLKPDVTQELHDYLVNAGAVVVITPTPAADAVAATATQVPLAIGADSAAPTHTVQAGDTLFSLATRFGVTVDELKAANNLMDDNIQVGQQLIIP